MEDTGHRPRVVDSALLWFILAVAASVGAAVLGRIFGVNYQTASMHPGLLLLASFSAMALVVVATWRLIRIRGDAWLLPLAAVNLFLLEPGRAGDPLTWRLEWGVFGVPWTAVAILLFWRLLRRTDELQRRIQLEGAATGLAFALPAAMLYALFEPILPPLRAQWVTIALLLFWWGGWTVSARRYR